MTAQHQHVSAAATGNGPDQPPHPDPGDAAPAGVICQAESVEIGIGGASTDPFDATFLLAGTDPQGREVAVWIRLTPTTINDLTEQLAQPGVRLCGAVSPQTAQVLKSVAHAGVRVAARC